jgi:hypothetical protein
MDAEKMDRKLLAEAFASHVSPDELRDHQLLTVSTALKAMAAARALSPPASAGEGFRDSVLSSARFRAACYKLVGIVEGVENRRWAADGERIKDAPEWVAFYNCVSNMRNGVAAPTPPAAAQEDGRDAKRYRWLKSAGIVRVHPMVTRAGSRIYADGSNVPGNFTYIIDGKVSDLDAAIDAAMLTSPDSGKENT